MILLMKFVALSAPQILGMATSVAANDVIFVKFCSSDYKNSSTLIYMIYMKFAASESI